MKRLIILVNIGTPDAPTVPAVRRYLKEFLSDPKVLTIPTVLRWLLLRLIILPFRSPKSTHAYQKVWTKRGSPLMFHSIDLCEKVAANMQDDVVVVGMRYGSPSIESVFQRADIRSFDEIVGVPLFPQFSDAATGSAVAEILRLVAKYNIKAHLKISSDFYNHPGFIEGFGRLIQQKMAEFKPDHILTSYHGLPESHVKATDETGKHCLASGNCCDAIGSANGKCYRAQSFATSRAIASFLKLPKEFYSVSFQSRLGRTPWIQPFTDVIINDLKQRGIKRLLVVCPSFVSDCLETLEEIGMRCREDWIALGGEDLMLVPCVNSDDLMAHVVVDLVKTSSTAV